MAYHAAGFITREFASRFTHYFIIRVPAPAIASLYRFWPDFTLEEASYQQRHRLFGLAVENGEGADVVDATDLTKDTEGRPTIEGYPPVGQPLPLSTALSSFASR